MNVLFTGRGTSGSWAIRGVQLGAAVGATVLAGARDADGFDLAVIVKRAPALTLRGPLVWDVIDWPSPAVNDWNRAECMSWMAQQAKTLKPAGIVATNRTMAKDCEEFGIPVLALPHHSWPGKPMAVIGEKVRRVGYQGGAGYLGRWAPFMVAECARRGWEWIVNPEAVGHLDIVVAVRHADGYAVRNWKSNVKLANAQGSGTPCVVGRDAGYLETASGHERWADNEQEMRTALDSLESQSARSEASAGLIRAAPLLHAVAKEYAAWLKVFLEACDGPESSVCREQH